MTLSLSNLLRRVPLWRRILRSQLFYLVNQTRAVDLSPLDQSPIALIRTLRDKRGE